MRLSIILAFVSILLFGCCNLTSHEGLNDSNTTVLLANNSNVYSSNGTFFIRDPADPASSVMSLSDTDNDGKVDAVTMDTDNDGVADVFMYDRNFDGKIDEWQAVVRNVRSYAWDLTNDSIPDVYDSDGDGIIDAWDLNSDTVIEERDPNDDGIVELHDRDFNGVFDEVEALVKKS